MAPVADFPNPDDPDELPRGKVIDRVLRVLEGVTFCCLTAMVVFWFADRLRSVDFEPILVAPCTGGACVPSEGPSASRPFAVFTNALEPDGVSAFSSNNLCVRLATLVQTQGEGASDVELIVDLMEARGTLMFAQVQTQTPATDQIVFAITPGPRNDGVFDAVRDAFDVRPSRGCHSMSYKPVFWPLFFTWIVLSSLRALRVRQAIWATR